MICHLGREGVFPGDQFHFNLHEYSHSNAKQHLLHAGWLILRDTCLSGINSDQWVDDGQYTNESQQQSVLWRMIGMMTF